MKEKLKEMQQIMKIKADIATQDLEAVQRVLNILARDKYTISIVWDVEDVKEKRPDLSIEECKQVLDACYINNAATGINYEVIEFYAKELFPPCYAKLRADLVESEEQPASLEDNLPYLDGSEHILCNQVECEDAIDGFNLFLYPEGMEDEWPIMGMSIDFDFEGGRDES